MKPLIEGVTPTKEALGLPVAWVCDERSVGSYTQDRRTCDACKHYTPSRFPSHMPEYKDCGECALTDLPWPDGTSNWQVAEDKLASWDVGDAGSGIHVGPKFGCIHWEKKT